MRLITFREAASRTTRDAAAPSRMAARYARAGSEGFSAEIRQLSERHEPVDEIYLLAESHYELIAGNLARFIAVGAIG